MKLTIMIENSPIKVFLGNSYKISDKKIKCKNLKKKKKFELKFKLDFESISIFENVLLFFNKNLVFYFEFEEKKVFIMFNFSYAFFDKKLFLVKNKPYLQLVSFVDNKDKIKTQFEVEHFSIFNEGFQVENYEIFKRNTKIIDCNEFFYEGGLFCFSKDFIYLIDEFTVKTSLEGFDSVKLYKYQNKQIIISELLKNKQITFRNDSLVSNFIFSPEQLNILICNNIRFCEEKDRDTIFINLGVFEYTKIVVKDVGEYLQNILQNNYNYKINDEVSGF